MGKRVKEAIITGIITLCGYLSIIFVLMICIFLIKEGSGALSTIKLSNLLSTTWYPIENYFGILPLVAGTLTVTLGASLFAIPLGICTAIFISEVAPVWVNNILKPMIELLAGLPSVVLGFIGILVLAPTIRQALDLPTGLTAFTGALLLGWAAIPTIASISEDSLNTVPKAYREAALALGATKWQVIWGVTLPAAKSGVLTASMLGVGRIIGETMAVMMVTGNAPVMPNILTGLFAPVRTMTATIASEMGEVAKGSQHYQVLFLIGLLLFILSFTINIIAFLISSRKMTRSERLLS
jgi:phosphate transport system permease protein